MSVKAMAPFGMDGKTMNEFDIIEKYFAPLSKDGLTNDAAVIDIPEGHQLVVTSDTLNAGTHFMADALPDQIAHKALRANVSDLYSMGATPLGYQLNIAFPERPTENWLKAFVSALKQDQEQFDIYCSGGDTTSIKGPLSISITAMGLVKTGKAWTRNGAKQGDKVLLSGCVGDAWIGLQVLSSKLQTNDDGYFVSAYYSPPLAGGLGGEPINAAIDISDGFVADLSHICKESNIGAKIDLAKIPFSPQAQRLLDEGKVTHEQLLTGGDDYVLIMASDNNIENVHEIGTFTGDTVVIHDQNGHLMHFENTGWRHF